MVKARGAGGGPEEGLDERVQSCTRTSSVTHQLEWISSLLEGRAAGAPGFVSGSERGCPVTRGTDQGTEQAKGILARLSSYSVSSEPGIGREMGLGRGWELGSGHSRVFSGEGILSTMPGCSATEPPSTSEFASRILRQ